MFMKEWLEVVVQKCFKNMAQTGISEFFDEAAWDETFILRFCILSMTHMHLNAHVYWIKRPLTTVVHLVFSSIFSEIDLTASTEMVTSHIISSVKPGSTVLSIQIHHRNKM